MTAAEPSILFLTRELAIGGAQRQLVELAAGLRRGGWDVTVATFYSGGELEADLRRANVRIVPLEKRGRWHFASFLWRLARLLRERSPDIVHGYLDVANVLLILLKPLRRRARVVWGVRASNMDNARYDFTWEITSRVSVWLARLTDLIICNSEAGRRYHAGLGYPYQRMIVIPNGIDTARFRPDSAARAAVRAELGIAETERLVGCVARLDPMKDHPTFLRAAARVSAARPHTRFVCVGTGDADYERELKLLADGLGLRDRLIWTGARNDMDRVYNALDVSVSASAFGEGFSNTLAESLATGVPCAATNVGDAELLLEGLALSRISPPGDAGALANAILELLAEPADGRSAELRNAIAQRYGTAALCERTAGELRQLLRQREMHDRVHAGTAP